MLGAGRGHTPIPLTSVCLEAIQETDSSGKVFPFQPLLSSFPRGYSTEIKLKVLFVCVFVCLLAFT